MSNAYEYAMEAAASIAGKTAKIGEIFWHMGRPFEARMFPSQWTGSYRGISPAFGFGAIRYPYDAYHTERARLEALGMPYTEADKLATAHADSLVPAGPQPCWF